MESYKHKFAKEQLQRWFIESVGKGKYPDSGGIPPFSFQPNRNMPQGVWLEYPVCVDAKNDFLYGIEMVWDEICEPEHNEWRGEDGPPAAIWTREHRPPTYDECIARGWLPLVVFDVALQHKGGIIAGIEVVHKHDVDAKKREYLRRICGAGMTSAYRIEADWILSQCGAPKAIVCTEITPGYERIYAGARK